MPGRSRARELIEEQPLIAALEPTEWRFEAEKRIGDAFVCFARENSGPCQTGDPAWAAACLGRATALAPGHAGALYEPGLLALREGALLEAAVRALRKRPDVLLVDATGRDHPRRAGLALALGAVLELPTVGVAHHPLAAKGRVAGRRASRPQPPRAWRRARRLLAADQGGHASAGRPCGLANRSDHGCGIRPPGLACPHTRTAAEGARASPRGTRAGHQP